MITTKLHSNPRGRGATVAGLGGLALASVLLLCGAGNLPVENFTPQGAMQADLNAGGHNVTNAATMNATNVAASSLTATTATVGSLEATNVTVSGALVATNFTLPFSGVTGTPATLAGYGIGDAYTKTAADARYSPLAGSTNVVTLGAVTAGSFPYANLSGNPVTVASGKTLGVSNALTLAGTDGSTLNIGAGGTLGSAAFAATNAFLAPSTVGATVEGYDSTILKSAAIGTTVQGYNANTTTLGNAVNGTNTLVQTDGNGLLIDAVVRPGSKSIFVSQGKGNDTRTGLSKYSAATPFATLTAAAGAAAAGDTIVAEDGVFTDKNITLATGVNWLFLGGATITITNGANGDTLFKDGGTATTVTMAGCGQVLALSASTTGTSLTGLSITAASNVTIYGLNFTVSSTNGTSNGTALYCNGGGSERVTVTGNLIGAGATSGSGYGVNMGSSGGGVVTVNGNVSGLGNGNGCGFNAAGGGTLTVSQNLLGSAQALVNSSSSIVTCGSLTDQGSASVLNNHLTVLSPPLVVQTATPATGFTQAYVWGEYDTILELTPAGTLAAGTVTLPADSGTRIGQRMTIATTQTITSLAVSVASGTIYGYSTGTLNAGSISFEKIAANVWVKL